MLRTYSEELRDFIRDKKSGMLLSANDYSTKSSTAYFELTSGKIAKEYITIWELFDHPKEFSKCIDKLAQEARILHGISPFTKIVTSTNTAKELVSHIMTNLIFPMIDSEKLDVESVYFGDYPRNFYKDNRFRSFYKENVLIITDVIASGVLIGKLTKIISDLGGNVIGVLAVVVTGKNLLDFTAKQPLYYSSIRTDSPVHIKIPGSGLTENNLDIFSLTTFAIEYLDKIPADSETFKIDPITVLPKEEIEFKGHIDFVFNMKETFDHLKELSAIKIGFFKFESKRFTITYDIPTIFSEKGKAEIWSKIQPLFKNVSHIVTTYKRGDIQFQNFVLDNLEKDIKSIILKRDLRDTPHFYFSIKSKSLLAKAKTVAVLVSALTTSTKLKNISSLLYLMGVKKVIFICLINRLGLYNHSFINSIRSIDPQIEPINGLTGSKKKNNGKSNFQFVSIYNVHDIFGEDLGKMHDRFNYVFDSFIANCYVHSFKRVAGQYKEMFSSSTNLVSKFYGGRMPNEPISRGKEFVNLVNYSNTPDTIEINFENQKLFVLINNFSLNRDYEPLIEEFIQNENHNTIHYLTGLFVCDIDFVIYNNILIRIVREAIKRLEELQVRRKNIEDLIIVQSKYDDSKYKIEKAVKIEGSLIFMIAIFAQFDDFSELLNQEILRGLLFANLRDKSPTKWEQYPLNFDVQFNDMDFLFSIALLSSGMAAVKASIYDAFRSELNVIRANFPTLINVAERKYKFIERISKEHLTFHENNLKHNIDLLLSEFGEFDVRSKPQIIRRLQNLWIEQKGKHNYYYKTLNDLYNSLAKHGENEKLTKEIKESIEECSKLVADLCDVNETIKSFFSFQTESISENKLYLTNSNPTGLSEQIRKLEGLLVLFNKEDKINGSIREEFIYTVKNIFNKFYYWEQKGNTKTYSQLQINLFKFITPAKEKIIEITYDMMEQLPAKVHAKLKNEIEVNFENLNNGNDYLTLCNFSLFKMVIQNLLSNTRYADEDQFDNVFSFSILFEKNSIIKYGEEDIYSDDDMSSRETNLYIGDVITIKMITPGLYSGDLSDRTKTISDHKEQLASLGNQLKIDNSNIKYTVFILNFISREHYKEPYRNFHKM